MNAREKDAFLRDAGHGVAHAMIVEQIVGRCHVNRSFRDVIGYVASRIKGGRKAFLRLPRVTRKEIMVAAVRAHTANRRTYARVMRGNR